MRVCVACAPRACHVCSAMTAQCPAHLLITSPASRTHARDHTSVYTPLTAALTPPTSIHTYTRTLRRCLVPSRAHTHAQQHMHWCCIYTHDTCIVSTAHQVCYPRPGHVGAGVPSNTHNRSHKWLAMMPDHVVFIACNSSCIISILSLLSMYHAFPLPCSLQTRQH